MTMPARPGFEARLILLTHDPDRAEQAWARFRARLWDLLQERAPEPPATADSSPGQASAESAILEGPHLGGSETQ